MYNIYYICNLFNQNNTEMYVALLCYFFNMF